jgi:uncharacterized protein
LASDLNLGDYLRHHRFNAVMQQEYILPMAAAIWSCPTAMMRQFPALSFLRFFANHGLLNINERPQWQTICNGSQTYINAILARNAFTVCPHGVVGVSLPESDTAPITLVSDDGERHTFDQIILACHGDESYQLLKHDQAFALLANFRYQANSAWLHRDARQMPQRRLAWASWNYLSASTAQAERAVAVTYWMNQLQPLATSRNLFVTLNPIVEPAAEQVIATFDYSHPLFDVAALAAQRRLGELQGQKRCWFAGAYTGYGFHEDGLASAVNIARQWQIPLPWEC